MFEMRFHFEMTFKEAMKIQDRQAVYYRRLIGRKGIKAIRSRTIYPEWVNPNEQMPITEINKYIPRGACFERYITHRPKTTSHDLYDMHNAMKDGKIYH